MRQTLIGIAKLVVSIALIWFALSKIDTSRSLALLSTLHPGIVVGSVILLLLQHLVGCFRFHRLLALMQTPVGFAAATANVYEGVFFSQIFISFIGGDAMRIWRLTTANVPASGAFKAVLFDRVLGFVSLILLILICVPFLFGLMRDPAMRTGIVSAIVLGLLGTVTFLMMHRLPAPLQRWRIFRLASDISTLALSISGKAGALFYLLGTSLIIQVANVVVVYLIALGLGLQVHFIDLLVLVPPVMLLAILPISFAGWGVREGSMALALGLVGISAEQSIAISICFGLALFVSGLPGAIVWLIDRKKLPGYAKMCKEEKGS